MEDIQRRLAMLSRLRDHFSLCVCAKEGERRLTLTDIEAPELVPRAQEDDGHERT